MAFAAATALFAHAVAQVVVEEGGGRLLEHLLVPALDRALALEQVHVVAVAVAEDLELDVVRLLHEALEEHALVAEGALRLAARGRELRRRIRLPSSTRRMPRPPPPATAFTRSGKPIFAAWARRKRVVLVLAVVAGHHRHAGLLEDRLGAVLEAHLPDGLGRGADEHEPRGLHRAREILVLREEAVARMDGPGAGGLRDLDDALAPEVGIRGARPADLPGLVGHLHVQRARVGGGMHRDRPHRQGAAGADHPAGDLPAVGDEDLVEQAAYSVSVSGSPCQSSS